MQQDQTDFQYSRLHLLSRFFLIELQLRNIRFLLVFNLKELLDIWDYLDFAFDALLLLIIFRRL
jgi:hypothetical protein